MVAASKAKPPQVTGDVLRASGAMILSHLATRPSSVPLSLTLPARRGRRLGFQFCCQADQMTAVDRATDAQPVERPVPRYIRASGGYVRVKNDGSCPI